MVQPNSDYSCGYELRDSNKSLIIALYFILPSRPEEDRTDEEETSYLLLELAEAEAKQQGKKQKKSAARNVRRSRPEAMFRGLGCRGKGKKRFQRYENGKSPDLSLVSDHDSDSWLDYTRLQCWTLSYDCPLSHPGGRD